MADTEQPVPGPGGGGSGSPAGTSWGMATWPGGGRGLTRDETVAQYRVRAETAERKVDMLVHLLRSSDARIVTEDGAASITIDRLLEILDGTEQQ